MSKRKSVSIKDIAKESGSSLTTVSLVLNSRDRRISEATRQRVLDAVQRLGYRPSRLAQGLQAQRSGILAILVPQLRHTFADVYFGELISAVHDCASGAGYKVLLEVANQAFVHRQQHLDIFDRRFVDGMLCIGVTTRDSFLADFEDGARPMIVVNNYVQGLRLNHVRCDYHTAGKMAGEYLLGLGHRNIALVRGAMEVQTTVDFRTGLEQALSVARIGLPDARVADGLYTEEGGSDAAVELARRDPAVTAIVAGNDKMAIGAISGLKEAGRRVPDDISVIGCDDIHQGAFSDPPLTTVHTPLYELGQRACERLLALINGEVSRVEEVQPVSLNVRRSAAPLKS